MRPEDPVGIIELGNQNISCLIFKTNHDNEPEILSTSITPSEGIYNDIVVNLTKASKKSKSIIKKNQHSF